MGSKAPKYDENKAWASQEKAAQMQAKYGTYGVNSSLGGLSTVQNPDGTYSLKYSDSNADTQRNNLITQGLSSLTLDPTQAANAYYSQATRQLLPQFETDQARLDEQLKARGINEGSALYQDQMNNLRQEQNNQLANIADQSVWQGQNYVNSQIGNIGALAGQRDVLNLSGMSGNTGASFQDTYSQKFAADQQAAQAKNAMIGGLASTGGAIVGAALGGPIGSAIGKKIAGTAVDQTTK